MSAFRIALVTAPLGLAHKLARGLVEAKLAACVNVVPRIVSHYRWEGKIHRDSEALLICKTRAALFAKLEAWVKKNHTYSVPEIVMLEIDKGHKPYLAWLAGETK